VEILYKTFNLDIHILLITILTYLKNSDSFLSDFCRNNKQKQTGAEEPAYFKILKEPILVQKKYITLVKAIILSFFEVDKGVALSWGHHAHLP
jgi:hypothetical protein